MHLGRKYKFAEYLLWMRVETYYLLAWSFAVTLLLFLVPKNFLAVPAPLLAVVGTAVAIVLAFKNQQCHARINEALALCSSLRRSGGTCFVRNVAGDAPVQIALR